MTSASLKSNDPRPPAGTAEGSPAAADRPDFLELLGDLSDAISVITVVHRSLEAKEIAEVGDEEVALRHGLALLRAAYSALDMASLRLG
jgi:hypothetical protein